jgi:hypothetical protein
MLFQQSLLNTEPTMADVVFSKIICFIATHMTFLSYSLQIFSYPYLNKKIM